MGKILEFKKPSRSFYLKKKEEFAYEQFANEVNKMKLQSERSENNKRIIKELKEGKVK